jgi:hypothetical protein
VGRELVTAVLKLAGRERFDLLSEAASTELYRSFPHFEKPGFRLHPFYVVEPPSTP